MTNLRSLSDLFKAAIKLAAGCAFAMAMAAAVSAQTNTFPTSGNAGIGTTTFDSGTSGLQIQPASRGKFGVLVTDTDGSRSGGLSLDSEGFGHLYLYDSGGTIKVRLAATSHDHTYFNGGGNVGIGTASPKSKLDIKQSEDTFVGGLHIRRASTNDTWALATGADNSLYMGYANNASGADAAVDFTVYPLVLTGAGNVGVGTADTTLGGVAASRFTVIQADASTGFTLGNTSGIPRFALNGNSNGTWTMYDYGSGAWTAGITQKSGSVGIGTSPNSIYKLDVNGEINATGIRINGTPISGGGSSQWTTGTSGNPIYYNAGNVGIGTTSPGVKLDVNGYIAAGSLNGFIFTDDLNTGLTSPGADKLNLVTGGLTRFHINDLGNVGIGIGTNVGNTRVNVQGADSTSANYALFVQNSSNTNLLSVRNDGNVGIGKSNPTVALDVQGDIKASGTIFAKYQDLAEWVPSSEQLSAATVVVLDSSRSNQVIASAQAYDTRVAGVISKQPGITLGESGEGKVLVATTGRVRVKVDASRGPIQIGDLLVTSDVAGVAMKSEAVNLGGVQIHRPGTIIGKALEPLAKGSGEILVLLSLQ